MGGGSFRVTAVEVAVSGVGFGGVVAVEGGGAAKVMVWLRCTYPDSIDVVPRDDVAIDVESLATKYPIVDWKTHILNENMMYYQIIRADGSSKNYKIFSEMHDDFDRQDVLDLHRLVNERYETTSLEGWRLFDSCGVHVLLMNTGVAIHMMIEKKYPLTQEMLSRMLNRRLEVDYESEMAFELLRFTRSQLQK
ncbi:hypothetical protein Tco_0790411 [Tanacetum coccineum]